MPRAPAKIKAGDVLWCYFPMRERPGEPAAALHPALILGVKESAGRAVASVVLAAYGSSQAHRQLSESQVFVGKLPKQVKPTIFDLSRRAFLPLTAAYFPSLTPFASLPADLEPEIERAFRAAVAAEKKRQ